MPDIFPIRGVPAGAAALALIVGLGLPRPTGGAPPAGIASDAGGRPRWVAPPVRSPRPDPERRAARQAAANPAADEGTPARVALGPGGRDLRLAGDLTEGVAARVAAVLAAHPGIQRIHLTSDGGLVDEASAIGDLVAAKGLSTYVPDACASACTLVFVRGRGRYLGVGGRLGFHAPYEIGRHGRLVAVDPAPERAAYRAAGLPRAFVDRAMRVRPADIWIPGAAQLRAAGVVTQVVGTDRFPVSTLDADPSLDGARAAILRDLPILRLADAGSLDMIARRYRDSYTAGRTEAEAAAGVHRLAGAYLRDRFRAADDRLVTALGRGILAALRGAGPADEAACRAIASGDLVALDGRLRGSRLMSHGLAPLLVRAGAGAPPRSGWRPGAQDAYARAGRAGDCGPRIAAARHALARPTAEAAAALRALFLSPAASDVASATAR